MAVILGNGGFDTDTMIRGELALEATDNIRTNFHLSSGKAYITGQITPYIQNIPQHNCFTEDTDRKGITFLVAPTSGIVCFDYLEEV